MSDLMIHEIYLSVQGESTHVGRPCVFVRVTGCPLRCTWCDTKQAYFEGHRRTLDEVEAEVLAFGVPCVEMTGGEPLAQPGVFTLIQRLCDKGLDVLIETSGAVDITEVDPRAHIIMDIKCPRSGMEKRTRWQNLDRLGEKDEAKFVIGDRQDYEYAVDVVRKYRLDERCHEVLFSPVFEEIEAKTLVEWILGDRLPVRFQLQAHKFIWAPDRRGV